MMCRRCEGAKTILYFGRVGLGGRWGPCYCQPEARHGFLTAYDIEVAARPKITVKPQGDRHARSQ